MRLPRLLLSFLLLGLVATLPTRALGQGSPYTVTVPVADTSAAQRDQAFGDALGQVLARVAGGQDLRGKSGYDDALKKAAGLVQQYQYQRGGAAAGGAPGGISLQVSFDAGAVQQLVNQMGVASAGVKPPVLLLVQDGSGKLLGQDALAGLAQAAAARGYQVAYADPSSLPDAKAVASADPAALAALAQHYKTGLALVGSLQGGAADWTLVAGGAPQHWSDRGGQQDLLARAGDALADHLGKQLNVIGTGGASGQLWVSGLHAATDYASLLATLRADPAVSQVATVEAENDGVLLSVKAAIPLDALAANLAAGGRLLQGEAHPGADASLRWLH
jgi:hypothetical protein